MISSFLPGRKLASPSPQSKLSCSPLFYTFFPIPARHETLCDGGSIEPWTRTKQGAGCCVVLLWMIGKCGHVPPYALACSIQGSDRFRNVKVDLEAVCGITVMRTRRAMAMA